MSRDITEVGNPNRAEIYVDTVEIAEFAPRSSYDDKLESAVLRRFLNVFNNLLYILISKSRDALRNSTDGVAYPVLKDIASAASELDAAVKRLQGLVEGGAGFREVATILVVDDQEAVRAVIVNTLERYGYTVLAVAGGSDALSRCGSYPGAIHLVLADVEMEPIDGYETVRRILLARPGMKVIYVSGNLPDYSRAMPGTEFLMKGDELANSLRDKVRQMLSRR